VCVGLRRETYTYTLHTNTTRHKHDFVWQSPTSQTQSRRTGVGREQQQRALAAAAPASNRALRRHAHRRSTRHWSLDCPATRPATASCHTSWGLRPAGPEGSVYTRHRSTNAISSHHAAQGPGEGPSHPQCCTRPPGSEQAEGLWLTRRYARQGVTTRNRGRVAGRDGSGRTFLSSFICLPPKISRCCGGGMPSFSSTRSCEHGARVV